MGVRGNSRKEGEGTAAQRDTNLVAAATGCGLEVMSGSRYANWITGCSERFIIFQPIIRCVFHAVLHCVFVSLKELRGKHYASKGFPKRLGQKRTIQDVPHKA